MSPIFGFEYMTPMPLLILSSHLASSPLFFEAILFLRVPSMNSSQSQDWVVRLDRPFISLSFISLTPLPALLLFLLFSSLSFSPAFLFLLLLLPLSFFLFFSFLSYIFLLVFPFILRSFFFTLFSIDFDNICF